MPNAYPAQSNQTRFTFAQRQGSSPGQPPMYDVIDGGGSMNAQGFVGSCSGNVIGQITYDPVLKRWSFSVDVKSVNLNPPGLAIGSADSALITAFITTLPGQSNVCPIVQ